MKYRKQIFIFGFLTGLFAITINCAKNSSNTPTSAVSTACGSSPVAKGSRQFGMDILDVPAVGTYNDSLANLKSLGGEFQTLHLSWNQIEGAGSGTTSGTFTNPSNALSTFNSLATAQGVKVTLRIHPVDVPGKLVPTDLSALRFNHATMKARAKSMLNYVFSRLNPANVTHLILGNEIDGYNPGADTNFWLDYADFLFDMNVFLVNNYPTVKLGFVITAKGATDTSFVLPSSGNQKAVDIFSAWMNAVNLLGITYYPLSTSLTMKPNSEVAAVFQKLVAFTSKPIHIEEVGYSTSATSSGSEGLQNEFYCEVLKSWDTYATQIPSLAVLRMVDKTRADAESVATTYGLTGNENFIEYIRTLGIRASNNEAKSAFTFLNTELKRRGF